MAEKIRESSWLSPPWQFAIAALVAAEAKGAEIPHVGRGYVEVALTVDGVEVPFASTIADIYDRMNKDLDRRAAELAREKLAGGPLAKLFEALQRLDWEVRDEIQKAFGVELPDD